jgi:hypothetical protein
MDSPFTALGSNIVTVTVFKYPGSSVHHVRSIRTPDCFVIGVTSHFVYDEVRLNKITKILNAGCTSILML